MKKEEFIKLGVDEKTAEKLEEASKSELSGYIPKSRFDEVNKSEKQLRDTISEYKNQLEELKSASGDNEELKNQIASLQEQNRKNEEEYQSKLKDLQITNAVKIAIGSTAHDSDIVTGLIDKTKLIISEDGKLTGLSEQLKDLKESKPFLFKDDSKPDKRGFFPSGPREKDPEGKDTHMSMKEAIASKLNLMEGE